MRSRKLSKRIEIWETTNVADGFGGSTVSEGLIASSWAEIITLNDINRSTDIGITSATNTIKVRLRKRNDITYNSINQFLKYRGFRYIIKNQPFNVGFRDDIIEIVAVKEELKSASANPVVGGIPVVGSVVTNFIQIDESYTYYVPATNSPTSYTAFGLIDGLSFDATTGVVTGTVTGVERLETMSFTASNEFGTSASTLIFFYVITDNANTFHPPAAVTATDIDTQAKDFILGWGYRPYVGVITFIEVWKDNVLVLNLPQASGGATLTSRRIQGAQGTHTYKLRFKNSANEFSGFSTEVTVTT